MIILPSSISRSRTTFTFLPSLSRCLRLSLFNRPSCSSAAWLHGCTVWGPCRDGPGYLGVDTLFGSARHLEILRTRLFLVILAGLLDMLLPRDGWAPLLIGLAKEAFRLADACSPQPCCAPFSSACSTWPIRPKLGRVLGNRLSHQSHHPHHPPPSDGDIRAGPLGLPSLSFLFPFCSKHSNNQNQFLFFFYPLFFSPSLTRSCALLIQINTPKTKIL